jgi:hypothetical protein
MLVSSADYWGEGAIPSGTTNSPLSEVSSDSNKNVTNQI